MFWNFKDNTESKESLKMLENAKENQQFYNFENIERI